MELVGVVKIATCDIEHLHGKMETTITMFDGSSVVLQHHKPCTITVIDSFDDTPTGDAVYHIRVHYTV